MFPDPSTNTASVTELYKNLESPRQYYNTVADSIPDPKTARVPSSLSMKEMGMHAVEKQSSSLQHKASFVQSPLTSSDQHISASEPRAFPGVVHERHRRQSARRRSHGTDDGHGTGSEMSSSFQLEPAMMRMRMKEDSQIAEVDDSE